MTVGEMIERLKSFDPTLTVCLADWSEAYYEASEARAERISISHEMYRGRSDSYGKLTDGPFLCIGE